jgi:hypothetical protein
MRQDDRDDFQAWLYGEILLFGLLGAALALFVTRQDLQTEFSVPQAGLVLQTVIAFAGGIIALLAGIRYAVEGQRSRSFRSSMAIRSRGPRRGPASSVDWSPGS